MLRKLLARLKGDTIHATDGSVVIMGRNSGSVNTPSTQIPASKDIGGEARGMGLQTARECDPSLKPANNTGIIRDPRGAVVHGDNLGVIDTSSAPKPARKRTPQPGKPHIKD